MTKTRNGMVWVNDSGNLQVGDDTLGTQLTQVGKSQPWWNFNDLPIAAFFRQTDQTRSARRTKTPIYAKSEFCTWQILFLYSIQVSWCVTEMYWCSANRDIEEKYYWHSTHTRSEARTWNILHWVQKMLLFTFPGSLKYKSESEMGKENQIEGWKHIRIAWSWVFKAELIGNNIFPKTQFTVSIIGRQLSHQLLQMITQAIRGDLVSRLWIVERQSICVR